MRVQGQVKGYHNIVYCFIEWAVCLDKEFFIDNFEQEQSQDLNLFVLVALLKTK